MKAWHFVSQLSIKVFPEVSGVSHLLVPVGTHWPVWAPLRPAAAALFPLSTGSTNRLWLLLVSSEPSSCWTCDTCDTHPYEWVLTMGTPEMLSCCRLGDKLRAEQHAAVLAACQLLVLSVLCYSLITVYCDR